ncbi:MAG: hypothetical protein H0T43_06995 [Solirubrobacterales bacterium]|nr:hypothetical protein [Solirubrobacterales bacterium]
MGYKLLGFTVWRGGLWYLRRRYGSMLPSRRSATAGVVVVAVVGLALAATRRESR